MPIIRSDITESDISPIMGLLLLSKLQFRVVCLFVVTFAHCAQTAEDIETISFAYDSPVYGTHNVLIAFVA